MNEGTTILINHISYLDHNHVASLLLFLSNRFRDSPLLLPYSMNNNQNQEPEQVDAIELISDILEKENNHI